MTLMIGMQDRVLGAEEAAGEWSSCSKKAGPTCPGPLNQGRYMHTATLLEGGLCDDENPPKYCGKVLVAGGDDEFCITCTPFKSAEIYDPEQGKWSRTASLRAPRTNHAATILSNGRVLVVGGQGDGTATEHRGEIYDPQTRTWESAGARQDLRRFYLTATPLPGDEVLIAGGTDDEWGQPGLDSALLYSSKSDRWRRTGKMVGRRSHHTANLLNDGTVLVAGGFQEGLGPLASAEIFDPGKNKWHRVESMSTRRFSHTASLLPSGEVLVAGGMNRAIHTEKGPAAEFLRSAELYDPKSNSWRKAARMNAGHNAHTASVHEGGTVLIAGGSRPFRMASRAGSVSLAEIYNPKGDSWSPAGEMNAGRGLHTATLLAGPACENSPKPSYCGRALMAGGGITGDDNEVSPPVEDSSELSPAQLKVKPSPTNLIIILASAALLLALVSWRFVRRSDKRPE